MQCAGVGAVRMFCSDVNSTSATSLNMLRKIEEVVTWLSSLQRQAEGEISLAENFITAVRDCTVKVIDPDDSIQDAIIESESTLQSCAELLSLKRGSAVEDQQLNGEYEDTIVSEYDSTVEAYISLHNMMSDLRWAILEHDANLEEESGEEYSSSASAIKALRA